jgi:hypothetical protein
MFRHGLQVTAVDLTVVGVSPPIAARSAAAARRLCLRR